MCVVTATAEVASKIDKKITKLMILWEKDHNNGQFLLQHKRHYKVPTLIERQKESRDFQLVSTKQGDEGKKGKGLGRRHECIIKHVYGRCNYPLPTTSKQGSFCPPPPLTVQCDETKFDAQNQQLK